MGTFIHRYASWISVLCILGLVGLLVALPGRDSHLFWKIPLILTGWVTLITTLEWAHGYLPAHGRGFLAGWLSLWGQLGLNLGLILIALPLVALEVLSGLGWLLILILLFVSVRSVWGHWGMQEAWEAFDWQAGGLLMGLILLQVLYRFLLPIFLPKEKKSFKLLLDTYFSWQRQLKAYAYETHT